MSAPEMTGNYTQMENPPMTFATWVKFTTPKPHQGENPSTKKADTNSPSKKSFTVPASVRKGGGADVDPKKSGFFAPGEYQLEIHAGDLLELLHEINDRTKRNEKTAATTLELVEMLIAEAKIRTIPRDLGLDVKSIIENLTERIEFFSAKTLTRIRMTERVLLRGIFEAADVLTPSSFVIVNARLSSGNTDALAKVLDKSYLCKNLGAIETVVMKMAAAAKAVTSYELTKGINKLTSWSLTSEEEFYLYLLDEKTMMPVVIKGDPVYPIVITKPAEFLAKFLPLMRVALKAVVVLNGLAGIARLLGYPIPTIPEEQMKNARETLSIAACKSSVEECKIVQECLDSELSGNCENAGRDEKTARGAPLREFALFLKQRDPNCTFSGLRRVATERDDQHGKLRGECCWTTEEGVAEIKKAAADEQNSWYAEGSLDTKPSIPLAPSVPSSKADVMVRNSDGTSLSDMKHGTDDKTAVKTPETLVVPSKTLLTQDELDSRIEDLTDTIKVVASATLVKADRVFLRAIFDAADIATPSSFVIVNRRLEYDAVDGTSDTLLFLEKLSAVGIVAMSMTTVATEAMTELTRFLNNEKKFYLYLLDELTMMPVVNADDPVYPIEISQPAEFIPKVLPLLMVALKAVVSLKGLAGIAGLLGYPTLPERYVDKATAMIKALGHKNSVDEYDMVQSYLNGKPSGVGGNDERTKESVRGAPLREFALFLKEYDSFYTFSGLRRVVTRRDAAEQHQQHRGDKQHFEFCWTTEVGVDAIRVEGAHEEKRFFDRLGSKIEATIRANTPPTLVFGTEFVSKIEMLTQTIHEVKTLVQELAAEKLTDTVVISQTVTKEVGADLASMTDTRSNKIEAAVSQSITKEMCEELVSKVDKLTGMIVDPQNVTKAVGADLVSRIEKLTDMVADRPPDLGADLVSRIDKLTDKIEDVASRTVTKIVGDELVSKVDKLTVMVAALPLGSKTEMLTELIAEVKSLTHTFFVSTIEKLPQTIAEVKTHPQEWADPKVTDTTADPQTVTKEVGTREVTDTTAEVKTVSQELADPKVTDTTADPQTVSKEVEADLISRIEKLTDMVAALPHCLKTEMLTELIAEVKTHPQEWADPKVTDTTADPQTVTQEVGTRELAEMITASQNATKEVRTNLASRIGELADMIAALPQDLVTGELTVMITEVKTLTREVRTDLAPKIDAPSGTTAASKAYLVSWIDKLTVMVAALPQGSKTEMLTELIAEVKSLTHTFFVSTIEKLPQTIAEVKTHPQEWADPKVTDTTADPQTVTQEVGTRELAEMITASQNATKEVRTNLASRIGELADMIAALPQDLVTGELTVMITEVKTLTREVRTDLAPKIDAPSGTTAASKAYLVSWIDKLTVMVAALPQGSKTEMLTELIAEVKSLTHTFFVSTIEKLPQTIAEVKTHPQEWADPKVTDTTADPHTVTKEVGTREVTDTTADPQTVSQELGTRELAEMITASQTVTKEVGTDLVSMIEDLAKKITASMAPPHDLGVEKPNLTTAAAEAPLPQELGTERINQLDVSQNLIKAELMIDAANVITPSSFVIMNRRLVSHALAEMSEPDNSLDSLLFLEKLSAIEIVETAVAGGVKKIVTLQEWKDKPPEAMTELKRFLNSKKKFYLYLLDELTMMPVVNADDPVYPIEISQPAEFIPKVLPLLMVALKAVVSLKGLAGIAGLLGYPTLPERYVDKATAMIKALGHKNNVDEYDMVQSYLDGKPSGVGESVRGVPLREFALFLKERDTNCTFSGLRRVAKPPGYCWTTEDGVAAMRDERMRVVFSQALTEELGTDFISKFDALTVAAVASKTLTEEVREKLTVVINLTPSVRPSVVVVPPSASSKCPGCVCM